MNYGDVKSLFDSKGYLFYQEKYRANLYGRRNKDLVTVDLFNDVFGVAYVDSWGVGRALEFAATTKPGLAPLDDDTPKNKDGVFIMAPGQHLNCWIIGFHHINDPTKKYEAFQQKGPGVFKGYRDGNGDGKFDISGPIYTNAQGVNGHHAGEKSTRVGGWSEGCQVCQVTEEHTMLLCVAKMSSKKYGNNFHYTLFQD